MQTGSPASLGAVDAHTAGGLVRLIVSGLAVRGGATMSEKAATLGRRAERLCDAAAREPRGHGGITLAVLTVPAQPQSDAGLLLRRAGRYLPFSGEALIAVTTIALERKLIVPAQPGVLQFDTEAGTVSVSYDADGSSGPFRVRNVRLVTPEAHVLAAGLDVTLASRAIRTDVVLAGEWLSMVDAESAGVVLTRSSAASLQQAGVVIIEAVERTLRSAPLSGDPPGRLAGVVFTGPASEGEACLRAAIVRRDGRVEHWPSGAALAAALAVLSDMGLAATGDALELEGLIGTRLRGRLLRQRPLADRSAVVVEVAGTAWITADHQFVLHADDPLRGGLAD
jgi:proline racemase